ncbi:unnamed protein product [Lasius platythorax]|uniref:Uncharacterized protein n=1 Tax=Lasius platythorax TaxID=488582 RepID=A0AAV2P575_9HYME
MTATQGNDFTDTLDDNWGLVREVGSKWSSFDVVPLPPMYLRCGCTCAQRYQGRIPRASSHRDIAKTIPLT